MNRWMSCCLATALCIGPASMALSQQPGQPGSLPGTSIHGGPQLPGPAMSNSGLPALQAPLGPLPPGVGPGMPAPAPHMGGGPLPPLVGPGLPPQAAPAPHTAALPHPTSMHPGPLRPTTRRSFRGYTSSLPSGVNPSKLSPLPSENIRELPYLRGYTSDRFVTPPGMEMPTPVPPGKPRQRTWGDHMENIFFPLGNPLNGSFRLPRLPGF